MQAGETASEVSAEQGFLLSKKKRAQIKRTSEKKTAVCKLGKNLVVRFKTGETGKFELVYNKNDRDVRNRLVMYKYNCYSFCNACIFGSFTLQHAIRLIHMYLEMERAHKQQLLSLERGDAAQQAPSTTGNEVRVKLTFSASY